MNTNKTKGDILAERIKHSLEKGQVAYCINDIEAALADYHREPWTLGRSVNGFTLGDGQEWHRNDWTEAMLPDGWRPLINNEIGTEMDQYHSGVTHEWEFIDDDYKAIKSLTWRRTRRPLPAVPVLTPEQIAEGWVEWHGGDCPVWGESKPTVMFPDGATASVLPARCYRWAHAGTKTDIIAYLPDRYESLKKAHSEGKVIQYKENDADTWDDLEDPSWMREPKCYRIKPEPVMVPLGPEDVPIGSIIRKIGEPESWHWRLISYLTAVQMVCADRGYPFKEIQHTHEISRDGGKTWERCEKEGK